MGDIPQFPGQGTLTLESRLFVFSVFMLKHLYVGGVSDSEYMFDKLSNIMVNVKAISRFVGGRLTSQKRGCDFLWACVNFF